MSDPAPMDGGMRSQDEDQVYFCENASVTSFSATLDEDSAMTEQHISEYIRYSNPDLYKKLGGMRVASSQLTSDDNECRESASAHGEDDGCESRWNTSNNGAPGLERVAAQHPSSSSTDETPHPPLSPGGQDQHFADVERFVLGRSPWSPILLISF
jgi:hypothetical protein